MVKTKNIEKFVPALFLSQAGLGRKIIIVQQRTRIFSQGDVGDAVFYIQKGRIKLTVISGQGKERTVSLLGPGSFVGEDCVANIRLPRMSSAVAMIDCTSM